MPGRSRRPLPRRSGPHSRGPSPPCRPIWDWSPSHPKIASSFSLGSSVSAHVASVHPRVAAVVLAGAFTDERAQLEYDRDVPLPITLMRASELRGRFIQFGKTNIGDERIVAKIDQATFERLRPKYERLGFVPPRVPAVTSEAA